MRDVFTNLLQELGEGSRQAKRPAYVPPNEKGAGRSQSRLSFRRAQKAEAPGREIPGVPRSAGYVVTAFHRSEVSGHPAPLLRIAP